MIDELPDAPDPATDSPTEFNAKAAALVLAQRAMVPQINVALGAMSSWAAGGAYAFQYTFDSATADADPGVGKLRLGSATQNASTVLRIDDAMVGGTNLSAVWADLLSVTSAVKGSLRLVNSLDVSKWMILDVTGSAAATGYRNLAVSVRASSEASPFGPGDPVLVYLQRGGDRGESGATGYLKVSDRKPSGVGGGASVVGPQNRMFNTVVTNDIAGASLASDVITLPAGTYEVFARAPAFTVGGHKLSLLNITDNNVSIEGSSAYALNMNTDSILVGRITISTAKTFRFQHTTQTAQSNGLGSPYGYAGQEIYTEAIFRKVA